MPAVFQREIERVRKQELRGRVSTDTVNRQNSQKLRGCDQRDQLFDERVREADAS